MTKYEYAIMLSRMVYRMVCQETDRKSSHTGCKSKLNLYCTKGAYNNE